jgi:hypothetical protein
MKKLVLLFAAGLAAIGCDTWTRTPPTLISPEEGEVFQTEAPSFSWGEQERIDSFRIVISTDSSLGALTLIDEELTATSYALNSTIFEGLPRGKYFWKVANIMGGVELWSEDRTFQIDHDLPELDLDTTYYPMTIGYKWIYQNWCDGTVYDTNQVEITSISKIGIRTLFTFTVTSQTGMEDFQYDLSTSDFIFGNLMYYSPGRVYPIRTSYDTLTVSSSSSGVWETPWESWYSGKRIKGVGLCSQQNEWQDYYYYQIYEDYLLYFIKCEDTVWTAD